MTMNQAITHPGNILLQQLGGQSKLRMVIGAKNFMLHLERGLQFDFKAGRNKGVNRVVITLNADDLYTMEFYRIWNKPSQIGNVKFRMLQVDLMDTRTASAQDLIYEMRNATGHEFYFK